jgi:hypothetical protein
MNVGGGILAPLWRSDTQMAMARHESLAGHTTNDKIDLPLCYRVAATINRMNPITAINACTYMTGLGKSSRFSWKPRFK